MLLDCGEGTLGQMYRFYGDQTHDVLKKLKGIFISHMHMDHYMGELCVRKQSSVQTINDGISLINLTQTGLFNLLRQVQQVKSDGSEQQPIALMGPWALQKRLELFNFAIQDVNKTYEFICNDQLVRMITKSSSRMPFNVLEFQL